MLVSLLLLISLLPSSALTLALCRVAARADRTVERYIPVRGPGRDRAGGFARQPDEDFWMFLLRQRSVDDRQHHR